MRFGEAKEYYREASLHDHLNNCGEGLMALRWIGDLPDDLISFCKQFYQLVKVEEPPEDVIRYGAWATYYAIDIMDPYALFCGFSDVDCSDDWCEFAYEVSDLDGKVHEITDPEYLESFVHNPGQDQKRFTEALNRMYQPDFKGIDEMPFDMSMFVQEWWDNEDPLKMLDDTSKAWLGDKKYDEVRPFFDLASWATWLWFTGPYGRDFRTQHHPIFNAVLTSKRGEAIVYEGGIFGGDDYTKLPRKPQSCVTCGLDAWCVEMVHIKGTSRFMCEHHVNGKLPLYGSANCGSRVCKFVACPYNSEYGKANGMHNVLTGRGQLFGLGSPVRTLNRLEAPAVKLIK
jgi:hypothetical protein